jgi:hypothetical protein
MEDSTFPVIRDRNGIDLRAFSSSHRDQEEVLAHDTMQRGTQQHLHKGIPEAIQELSHSTYDYPAQECGTDQLRGAKPFLQRFPQVILTPEIRDVFDHGC